MNIFDIIIIGFIIVGALLGFSNGVIKTSVGAVGFIVITILSFLLKGVVAGFLFKFCPFFNFWGVLEGVTTVNILLYEVVAFVIIFGVLYGILKVIIMLTGIVESLLKATVVLSIPSKLLGAVVGALENFFVVFIVLYFISLPFFGYKVITESKLKDKILYNTPVLSSFVSENVKINSELTELIEIYRTKEDRSDFNLKTLDLMLKYKIVDVETVEDLIERNKLKIDFVYTVLDKYR